MIVINQHRFVTVSFKYGTCALARRRKKRPSAAPTWHGAESLSVAERAGALCISDLDYGHPLVYWTMLFRREWKQTEADAYRRADSWS